MSDVKQFVGFQIGGECYGVGIDEVDEVIRKVDIVAVPKTPPYVEGIINLRGVVIPIVDLRKRLNLFDDACNDDVRVVILNTLGKRFGAVVDSVGEVHRIKEDEIGDVPLASPSKVKSKYIKGIAKTAGGLVILLDILKLFAPEEQSELTSIAGDVDAD